MPRPKTPPRAGKREILIRAGPVAIRARLLDTSAADCIWQALPIYTTAEMCRGTFAFEAPVPNGTECSMTRRLELGEIALHAAERRVLIACDLVSSAPVCCEVWALALDDVTALAGVRSGDRVAVLEADS